MHIKFQEYKKLGEPLIFNRLKFKPTIFSPAKAFPCPCTLSSQTVIRFVLPSPRDQIPWDFSFGEFLVSFFSPKVKMYMGYFHFLHAFIDPFVFYSSF